MKRKAKSLPKLKADLQLIFNKFIRLRDAGKPCISCGLPKDNIQAGHFYCVKQYDGECAGCNCFDEMHLLSYAANLVDRIGIEKYNVLKVQAAAYKRDGYKWSRSELESLIEKYKAKVKELS